MPGVTVTATSPQAMAPTVAVTDATGEYRLANLPPGTYTLKVELPGFSIVIREGISCAPPRISRSTSSS